MLREPFGSSFISSPHGAHVVGPLANGSSFLYVTDVGDGKQGHAIHMFEVHASSTGTSVPAYLRTFGTAGQAGTGLNPVQFGAVADVAGDPDVPEYIYVVDGDGGPNNRLLKLNVVSGQVEWHVGGPAPGAGRGAFDVPHSVALQPATAGAAARLWVADRSNNRTVALSLAGEWLGQWNCTRPGMPWGVRVDAAR